MQEETDYSEDGFENEYRQIIEEEVVKNRQKRLQAIAADPTHGAVAQKVLGKVAKLTTKVNTRATAGSMFQRIL